MRFTLLSLALVIGALAFVSVSDAHAQVVYVSPGYGYSYYAPTYPYTYSDPGAYYAPSWYVPPYSWSAGYYSTPRGRAWSYGTYYPYTNQYRYSYGYRYYPRWRR